MSRHLHLWYPHQPHVFIKIKCLICLCPYLWQALTQWQSTLDWFDDIFDCRHGEHIKTSHVWAWGLHITSKLWLPCGTGNTVRCPQAARWVPQACHSTRLIMPPSRSSSASHNWHCHAWNGACSAMTKQIEGSTCIFGSCKTLWIDAVSIKNCSWKGSNHRQEKLLTKASPIAEMVRRPWMEIAWTPSS